MPAIANSASAQSSSMFPRAQALSMASPKSQPASDTRAESPVSTTSESSTASTASILSQQSMTASALFVGNNNIRIQQQYPASKRPDGLKSLDSHFVRLLAPT
ncbi:hypothetical protein BJ741DRAFT_661957 [Chytriomyces cf. hyalinus JEL632]|nr:hypothetical protein BJ741DRAFT_661957 [Chytriomyces cf. hyalinus JEL632]